MRFSTVNSKYIVEHENRMEGKYYINDGSLLCMTLDNNVQSTTTLDKLANVFNPPVFKRQFCVHTHKSVQYFQSSDVPSCIETSPIYVNRKQSEDLNLLVKKNDILVTGFGTIGNTKLVTKQQIDTCFANNVCRIQVIDKSDIGFIYTFLSSKYGIAQLNKNASGSVVRYIEAPGIKKTLIPNIKSEVRISINKLIEDATMLREEASDNLASAKSILVEKAQLKDISSEDYDYYGARTIERQPSIFTVRRKDITTRTINAFNHSLRIRNLQSKITCKTIPLSDAIEGGEFFTTGSFPRIEVKEGHGIHLINQSDIFDIIVKGKYISKKGVKTTNLVDYGEILIAGVGTLGESESFCRVVFANEDLVGQLVSGEFLRMKSNSNVPSGYLYTWLSSDFGFRLIRSTQTGTKLCRPIQSLLLEKPVPIIEKEDMQKIDSMVKEAFTKKYKANQHEREAIKILEQEIEKWNK